jgi:NAD(P)H-nitrite reductase large subunit
MDPDTEICGCNNLSAKDIADCIKENDLKTLTEILENKICPMGDKCESCLDEGFSHDGYTIPMVLSMVQKNLI